jgi:hypothetical protein
MEIRHQTGGVASQCLLGIEWTALVSSSCVTWTGSPQVPPLLASVIRVRSVRLP